MVSPEAGAYRHHASEPGDRPAPSQWVRCQTVPKPASQQVRTTPASPAAKQHHASEPGDRAVPHQRARRQTGTMPASPTPKQHHAGEPGTKPAPVRVSFPLAQKTPAW